MKVLIGVPSYEGKLNIELIKFLDNIQVPEGWGVGKCYVTRTPIHMARNMILQRMIEEDYDYVIMIDDDEYPEKIDCFLKLLESGKDMISGVVRLRVNQKNLNILKTEIYEDNDKIGMKRYVNYEQCPNGGVFQIGNAGSGLICLSKEVCKKMLEKYAKEPFESKATVYLKLDTGEWEEVGYNKSNIDMSTGKSQLCRRVLSEDYLFFERAQQQGFKLYCHGACKVIHLGDPQKIVV